MAGRKITKEGAKELEALQEMLRTEAEAPEEQENLSVEESFRRLDEITGRMEREEITLEESFRLFQEGMELVKRCGGQLADVEKKMILLEEEYQG